MVLMITGKEVKPLIEISISQTILELKQKIEDLTGVQVFRQTLDFDRRIMSNDKTVSYYFGNEVYPEDPPMPIALTVQPLEGQPRFNILVRFNDGMIGFVVRETTLVADLKRMIEECTHILSKYVKLRRLDKEMEDQFPLSEYYICVLSHVEMTLNFDS